jgi:hypothetical protein
MKEWLMQILKTDLMSTISIRFTFILLKKILNRFIKGSGFFVCVLVSYFDGLFYV